MKKKNLWYVVVGVRILLKYMLKKYEITVLPPQIFTWK
jgi:hypothetical protein